MCKHKKKIMKPSGSNYEKFRSIIPILRVANPLKKFQKPCKCRRKGCNISPGMKAELEDLHRHRSPKQSQLMSLNINVRRKRTNSFQSRRAKYLPEAQPHFTYYLFINGRKLPTCRETLKQIFSMTNSEIQLLQRKLKQDLKSWKRRYRQKLMCIRAANSIKRRYTKQVSFDMCQIPDFPTPPMSPINNLQDDEDDCGIFEEDMFINGDEDALPEKFSLMNDKIVSPPPQVKVSSPLERALKRVHCSHSESDSIVGEAVTPKKSKTITDHEVGESSEALAVVVSDEDEASQSQSQVNSNVNVVPSICYEKPRCLICEDLNGRIDSIKGESEHETLVTQLSRHQAEAQAALKSYAYDMSRIRTEKKKALVVMGIELQKIIFTTELQSSLRNYNQKLNSSDFAESTGKEKQGGMILTDTLWSDKDTETGANEISSCLWKYFKKYKPLEPGERRELILWTETCSSQSMNFIVLALLILSVRKNFFSSACHKMFYPGHSIFPDTQEEQLLPLQVNNNPIKIDLPPRCNNVTCCDETQSNRIDSTCTLPGDEYDLPSSSHPDINRNSIKCKFSSPVNQHYTSDLQIVTMEEEDFLNFKKVYELIGCPATLSISGELCLKYDQDRSGILMSKNQHLLDRWKDHTLPNYTKKTEKRKTTLLWDWGKIDDFTPPKLFSEAVLQEIHKTIPKDFQQFYVDMIKYSKDFDRIYSNMCTSNSPKESPKWLETIQDLEESLLLLQDADNH